MLLVLSSARAEARGDRLARRAGRDRRRVPHARHHGRGRREAASRSAPRTARMPRDYDGAIDAQHRRSLLKVHTSNYRIVGFTAEVALASSPRSRASAASRSSRTSAAARWSTCRRSACRASRRSRERSRPAPTSSRSAATSCWAARRPASSSGARDADRAHQPQSAEARAADRQDLARRARSDAEALSRSATLADAPADAAHARAPSRGHRRLAPPRSRRARARARRRVRDRGRRLLQPGRLRRAAGRDAAERGPRDALSQRPSAADGARRAAAACAACPPVDRPHRRRDASLLDLRCLERTRSSTSSRSRGHRSA